uniref:Uncharacterized protein n=1 Tax=Neolamprologus brichardi TaxID=32507 RepID=A0A3Q4G610_NEOBR
MAAEIQPQPQARKPCLLSKIDAFQEVVSTAVIIPKEDGVISVSEDSCKMRHCKKLPLSGSCHHPEVSGTIIFVKLHE